MRPELIVMLNSLDAVDLGELDKSIRIAASARSMIVEFIITKEEFGEMMGFSVNDADAFLRGSYPYNLRILARFDLIYLELRLEREKADRSKESIQFPEYKNSKPVSHQNRQYEKNPENVSRPTEGGTESKSEGDKEA